MTTWILCPNLRGARLFQCRDLEEGVRFLREFPHPKVHFNSDDFDSGNDVPQEVQDPVVLQRKKEVAESFMRFLAEQLEQGAQKESFDSLLLCAEPQLLAILQGTLGRSTRRHLLGSVDVDLYEVNETDLISYVKDFLEQAALRRSKKLA